MSLEQVTTGMREAVGEDCGLGASVKWDFGDGAFLMLDACLLYTSDAADE